MSRILMERRMKNMSKSSCLFRSKRVFRKCYSLYVSFSFSMYFVAIFYRRGILLDTTEDTKMNKTSPSLFEKEEIHLNFRAVYRNYYSDETYQMLWILKGDLIERKRNFKRHDFCNG